MFPRFLPDGKRFLYTAIDVDPDAAVRLAQLALTVDDAAGGHARLRNEG